MLVVADSSPLIALVNIERIDILPTIFGQIVIPPEISAELFQANRPQAVRDLIASRPQWLLERAPTMLQQIPLLHSGEQAAISLAIEIKADLLLIDELIGRKAAIDRGLKITGTIGILEMAARRGLLDLREAFKRLKESDFWISQELLDERLQLFFK